MLLILALAAAAAPPADKPDATCPATRFTLNMPVAAKPQPKPEPSKTIVAQAAPAAPKAQPKAKAPDCLTKKRS
jgi:hypothetical protein